MILGIDQSLTATGIVAISDKGIVHSETLRPKKMRGLKRLAFIKQHILHVVQTLKPHTVVFEGYAMGIRGGKVFDLGELGGILKLAVAENHPSIGIYVIPPKTLKKFFTGSGNADKDRMKLALVDNYSIEMYDNDQVDALALALAGMVLIGANNAFYGYATPMYAPYLKSESLKQPLCVHTPLAPAIRRRMGVNLHDVQK